MAIDAASIAVSGVAASSLPAIRTAILIGRGGASIAAASAVFSTAKEASLLVPRGGKRQQQGKDIVPSITGNVELLGLSITPEARSVLCMAIAMSLHYLGYSFARPSTLSLFTSETAGYSSSAAFPLAMAFVSPMALLLLMAYGRILNHYGPRGALTRTSIFCSCVLCAAATAIATLEDSSIELLSIPLVKFITGPLFVFRESYVQLLTSQYWSFMASVLTPSQSATWFAPISGLTSITSALAGLSVSSVVEQVGLPGSLLATGIMLLLSLVAARTGYSIAEQYGFDPTDEIRKKADKKKKKKKKKRGAAASEEGEKKVGMIQEASDLFRRVPTLWALFLEILSSQGLATLLNVCFVSKLRTAVPDDSERAGWMGKFFALINVISMGLQFAVLPRLMTFLEPRDLWRAMPLIMMCFTTLQAFQRNPSLYIVSGSLLVMKTLEYSARRMLDEMVYVPLDFESRYVGKEVIGVFGYRFGKSSMSLVLSALTSVFGNFGLQELSILTGGASLLWLTSAWRLSNLVLTREQAELTYQEAKSDGSKENKKRR